jgi:predicted alpha/beta-hydrolase family hydrolase
VKPAALLLTPGAGSDRNHPALRAIESAVAPMPTARIDFPYRKAGRRAPDRAPKLIDCIREEAAVLVSQSRITPSALALGGRSMGGRMCSLAVAEGLPAAALVLISYPLHPPGKPESLRVDHFGDLDVPCLFVSGTKDPFGSPTELERHTKKIAGPVSHVWVEGGGHDFKRHDNDVAEQVHSWLGGLGKRRAR